jgi:hypothetical protein
MMLLSSQILFKETLNTLKTLPIQINWGEFWPNTKIKGVKAMATLERDYDIVVLDADNVMATDFLKEN